MGQTLHNKRRIVIGETFLKDKPANWRVLFHETGHAFDFSKKISGSQAYVAAFTKDSSSSQPAGFDWKQRSEVCAQLVAVELCSYAKLDVNDNPKLTAKFSEAWPHCAQIVRAELQPFLN